MKIYTEIVYTWDDNLGELVEESSKSFEYQGEISQCHRKMFPHPHGGVAGQLYDAGTDIGEGLADLGSDILGGAADAASQAAQIAQEKTNKAWSGMQNLASDYWEKGAQGLSDLWAGTGMEEMAARWTDKAAMKEAWMPGKWTADSVFQSRWMMGLDMVKHMKGFNMGDFRDYKKTLFSDFDTFTKNAADAAKDPIGTVTAGLDEAGSILTGGTDAIVDNIETNLEGAGDTLGIDEAVSIAMDAGQDIGEAALDTAGNLAEDAGEGITNQVENVEGVLEDNSGVLSDAEDKINANIAGANEDIETGIDENTDTLNQMEDTINSNVADANVALDNLNAVVNDTSTIINQGLDASININNPNALITNPQGWYDANIEGLRQGPGKVWYDWVTGKDEDAIIEHGATNIGNLFQDYGEDLGNMFGGLMDYAFDWSDDGASDELRNRRRPTNAGDPFGLEGTSRRLVESQDTFQSRQNRKAQMAPSMINKGNYA